MSAPFEYCFNNSTMFFNANFLLSSWRMSANDFASFTLKDVKETFCFENGN
jgi:hypothetical protein